MYVFKKTYPVDILIGISYMRIYKIRTHRVCVILILTKCTTEFLQLMDVYSRETYKFRLKVLKFPLVINELDLFFKTSLKLFICF